MAPLIYNFWGEHGPLQALLGVQRSTPSLPQWSCLPLHSFTQVLDTPVHKHRHTVRQTHPTQVITIQTERCGRGHTGDRDSQPAARVCFQSKACACGEKVPLPRVSCCDSTHLLSSAPKGSRTKCKNWESHPSFCRSRFMLFLKTTMQITSVELLYFSSSTWKA